MSIDRKQIEALIDKSTKIRDEADEQAEKAFEFEEVASHQETANFHAGRVNALRQIKELYGN